MEGCEHRTQFNRSYFLETKTSLIINYAVKLEGPTNDKNSEIQVHRHNGFLLNV